MDTTVAVKDDTEKSKVELLSPLWIMGVGQVLGFGAKKYCDHNWRKGLAVTRCLGAALRHIFAFLGGEDLDPESKQPHLLHASCSLMFAYELWKTRPDLDDRWKPEGKKNETRDPKFLLDDSALAARCVPR
jgi:hypothetical protein